MVYINGNKEHFRSTKSGTALFNHYVDMILEEQKCFEVTKNEALPPNRPGKDIGSRRFSMKALRDVVFVDNGKVFLQVKEGDILDDTNVDRKISENK